jgi:murein DD-endopeptidase MepM/ murein hydrolase activator NlpD
MISKIYGFFSRKRKVVLISDKGIVSKEIDLSFCIWNLLFILWVFFTTAKYFEHTHTLAQKNKKIDNLTYSNITLKSNIKSLKLVQNYVESLNQYDRFKNIEAGDKSFALKTNEKELSNKYNDKFASVLDRDSNNMQNLNLALIDRINGLEKVIEDTGLSIKNIHQASLKDLNRNKNLEIVEEENNFDKKFLRADFNKNSIKNNIDYLTYLETVVEKMPLKTPINNYFITSGFGGRRDPFTRKYKTHKGLDMAGPINAKIYTPSSGKVIFSGTRGGYGRSVEIDHGNGLRTEYGHLKRIYVNKGDRVKKGQAIGVQGNTGKSTGTHLHYEIQFNKKPIDPKKFIEVGDKVF